MVITKQSWREWWNERGNSTNIPRESCLSAYGEHTPVGHVECEEISTHVIECALLCDVFACLPNHDSKFDFIVDLCVCFDHQWLPLVEQRWRSFREYLWSFWRVSCAFREVVLRESEDFRCCSNSRCSEEFLHFERLEF